jgi:hypothetical protein
MDVLSHDRDVLMVNLLTVINKLNYVFRMCLLMDFLYCHNFSVGNIIVVTA